MVEDSGSAQSTAGDAVVIPIGTGGRPGRGTGRGRPSAAARNLAPAKKTPAKKAAAKKPAVRKPPVKKAAAAKTAAKPAKKPSNRSAPSTPTAPAPPPADDAAAASDRPRVHTEDRDPGAGSPLADLLGALHSGAHDIFGEDWERRLAELLAFVRGRLEGNFAVDEYGFDDELTRRVFMTAVRPLAHKWFRMEVRGLENIPTEGGALVVSNHSGTVPVDGMMTMFAVHERTGRFLRPLAADLVFKLPIVSTLARKTGATLACTEDAERMLAGGELVGVWPEGFKGIGKPFSERYKLQRFGRGGFVSSALRTGVPIIPLSVVGAEEIYPLVGNIPSLARLLGVPYIPITPFFPWLGLLGMVPLPSKWILEFGEPIRTDSYDAVEAEDPMLVFNVTDQVRETIQHTLFDLLRDRDGVFG